MRKPFVRGAVAGLVACVLLLSLCAACPLCNTLVLRPLLAQVHPRYVTPGVGQAPFDPEGWRTGSGNRRLAMARWLEKSGALEGRTRAEVVAMLGEPDLDEPGDEGVRWLLGFHAKGLFDESKWLVLTIGEDGKATGVGVWTDWYDPRR